MSAIVYGTLIAGFLLICPCKAGLAQEAVAADIISGTEAVNVAVDTGVNLSERAAIEECDAFDELKRRRQLWLQRVYYAINYAADPGAYGMDVIEAGAGVLSAEMVPSDPYYGSSNSWGQGYDDLWGLKRIGAEAAWDISKGEGTIVAVLDTGLDFTHPEIVNNFWVNDVEYYGASGVDDDGNGYIDDINGWDFIGADSNNPVEDNDPEDVYGHGTHVAGIIAAEENNEGIVGIAPEAEIMVLKVLDNVGSGTWEALADAIEYAVNNGARIINMSLGSAMASMPVTLRAAIDYAYDLGCVLVASVGNDGNDVSGYVPANDSKILAVSAMGPDDTIASFSNYGSEVDVAAPGVDILSLRASGTYVDIGVPLGDSDALYYVSDGTSMAAPFVAGLAAMLYSDDPTLSNDGVMNKIRLSAEDLGGTGFDEYFGYGLINSYDALTLDFSTTFDMLEYESFEPGNIWTYYEAPTGITLSSEVTGVKKIKGVDTMILYETGDIEGSDYVTMNSEGYKLYGFSGDMDGNGSLDEVMFDSPVLMMPRYISEGSTYYGSSTFTYTSGITIHFKVSTTATIHGTEDVTLDSGVVMKNALKFTVTLVIQDTDGYGSYESETYTVWYVKDLGEVKRISSVDEENIRTAVTHYESGLIRSKFLENADPVFVYYEYLDENFETRGYGRLKKAQRPDGSYERYTAYWAGTENVKMKEIYDVSDGSLRREEYYANGFLRSGDFSAPNPDNITYYEYYNEGIDFYPPFNHGRVYIAEHVDNGEILSLGYIRGTAKALVMHKDNVSTNLGNATLYNYFDETHLQLVAARAEFDGGDIAEVVEVPGGSQLTKLIYSNGDRNWFLWGSGVYQGYDNVIIEHLVSGAWNAYYGFTPDMENPDNVADDTIWRGNLIGPVADPGSLILPELGDWWEYCFENDIIPEFPSISNTYTNDSLDRRIGRVSYNPIMDTAYTYEWDYETPGQVKMDMSYDYNEDGIDELICSWIYENGTDYDLANIDTWRLIEKTNLVGGITCVYHNSGRLFSKTYATPKKGVVEYRYYDEAFYKVGLGDEYGRIQHIYKEDGKILVHAEYWAGTDIPKRIEEYDASWGLVSRNYYFVSGHISIKKLTSPENGNTEYRYYDEAFYNPGQEDESGRIRIIYKEDGTKLLNAEYWPGTDIPKRVEVYDSSWTYTGKNYYFDSGHLSIRRLFVPENGNTEYRYYDETFYNPGQGDESGRIRIIYKEDGTKLSNAEYWQGTDVPKRVEVYDVNWTYMGKNYYFGSGHLSIKRFSIPDNDIEEYRYYDEAFYNVGQQDEYGRVRITYKTDGTKVLCAEYWAGTDTPKRKDVYDSNWTYAGKNYYFESGHLSIKRLVAPDNGNTEYRYYDEAFYNVGQQDESGRIRFVYKTDGTKVYHKEYWSGTDTPKVIEEYNSGWDLTNIYEYDQNGNPLPAGSSSAMSDVLQMMQVEQIVETQFSSSLPQLAGYSPNTDMPQ